MLIDELIKAGEQFENDSIDEFSRYKSWEFCYERFRDSEIYNGDENKKTDELAIHLSLYLASWGMYRGSTFLLNKNYTINKKIVEEILKFKQNNKNYLEEYYKIVEKKQLEVFIQDVNFFNEIVNLGNIISKAYEQNNVSENVTDTLRTKIIMGTLGITPAYDNFFKDTLKELIKEKDNAKNINNKFNSMSIQFCYNFYLDYFEHFENIRKDKNYPIMKIFDMCLWQYQKNIKEKEKNKQKAKQ